jgi:hypothetical protein
MSLEECENNKLRNSITRGAIGFRTALNILTRAIFLTVLFS